MQYAKPISSILDAIGNTPMLNIDWMDGCRVFAKAEFLNPGGSIKDRIAGYIISKAEERGELRPGMTIVEATSGNTGIGVTLLGKLKGYNVKIIMPESMSAERKKLISALGAELVLTTAEESFSGAIKRREDILAADSKCWSPRQFENPDNPACHYSSTGPEIWAQMDGKIDAIVAGVGSGGTLQGVGKFLKEQNPNIRVVAVEPQGHSALLGQEPGLRRVHAIQGIGDGFVPPVLDTELLDDVITVYDNEAITITRGLARDHGILVGTSSGANVFGAVQMVKRLGEDANVVTILPDRIERYFSTALI